MDYLDSVRRAARHYPGGPEALAVRLRKSFSTLEKELRGATGYKLGAVDAAEIAAMCVEQGSDYGLEYPTRLAEAVGATLLVLPRGTDVPDGVTAQTLAGLVREFADVVSSATLADADGEISRNELLAVERQWAELVAAGQALMRHLDAKHQRTMAKWHAREGGAA